MGRQSYSGRKIKAKQCSLTFHLGTIRAGFLKSALLSFGTVQLCCGGRHAHCRMDNSILGLHPLDARSSLPQEMFPDMPHVPWEQNFPPPLMTTPLGRKVAGKQAWASLRSWPHTILKHPNLTFNNRALPLLHKISVCMPSTYKEMRLH